MLYAQSSNNLQYRFKLTQLTSALKVNGQLHVPTDLPLKESRRPLSMRVGGLNVCCPDHNWFVHPPPCPQPNSPTSYQYPESECVMPTFSSFYQKDFQMSTTWKTTECVRHGDKRGSHSSRESGWCSKSSCSCWVSVA